MTYLNTSDILEIDSPEALEDYVQNLDAEQEFPDTRFVIDNLRTTPDDYLPTPYNIVNAFVLYAAKNRQLVYKIGRVAQDLHAVYWEGEDAPHVIFVVEGTTFNYVTRMMDERINMMGADPAIYESWVNALAIPLFADLEERDYAISLGLWELPLVPENSATLDIREDTARFSGALWYEAIQKKTIVLAGVGGIGSYVGFLLARMKPASLFIYDDDKVEAANMSGQLYSIRDIDRYKAEALADMVQLYADYHSVFAITQRYTAETEPSKIMICGFDNMAARETFFNKWVSLVDTLPDEEKKSCLYIDGRLAAEDLQVYCITGDNRGAITFYSTNCLFSDNEADDTVCSYKQTTYMANMIGSIIVNLFTNFVANELVGAPIRELPFFTEYSGATMHFKITMR